jgi:hypothetical protein
MPEIENIALREALKDFGFEHVSPGEDLVVHVETGPNGLFVTRAEKLGVGEGGVYQVPGRELAINLKVTQKTAEPARLGEYKLIRDDVCSSNEVDRLWSSDAPTSEALEALCREAPEKALDLGIDVLARINDTMSAMVEDNTVRIAQIEAHGQRLERLNDENKLTLAELLNG